MNPIPYALLAEDDANTALLIEAILKEAGAPLRIERVANGEAALEFLRRRGAFDGREEKNPAVLLMDLEMPRMDGLELLREVKSDPQLKLLPVVVMAGTFSAAKIQRCYELGANALVVKPSNFAEFAEFVRILTVFWLTMNQSPPLPVSPDRT
jgi:CheY-like chemotaxis protein